MSLYMETSDKSLDQQSATGEWPQHDEAALWKSRALSLYYENEMLHKHIKQLYNHLLQYNVAPPPADPQTYDEVDACPQNIQIDNKAHKNKSRKPPRENHVKPEAFPPPENRNLSQNQAQMKELYGTSYQRITGMETAVQLNYDMLVEKDSLKPWPIVPIRV